MIGKLEELQGSIDQTVSSIGRLSGADDEAIAAQDRLTEAMTVLTGEVERLDGRLVALATTQEDSIAATDANTMAIDEQSAAMRTAGDTAETSRAKTGLFGSAGKTAFLGVAAAVGYSVVKAAEYQSQMTTLLTQAGVAKSQFKGLESGVLALAGQVGFSPTSLGMALYHIESSFASVGITGPKALSLLKIAAEGAAVGHADLVDVTNALDATIASGVPGVKNYSQAMGALNAVVGSGDMTMQDLADAMGTGAMAQAKLFGQSIYQVGAALATFGDNNIRGAKAATDLRMTWQALQSPMKAGIPVLQQLGLGAKTLADTMTHHGLTAALAEFVSHLKAAKVPASEWGQIITEIFGKRAGTGIGVLTDQLGRLESKLPDLKKGADGFGQAWKTTQATVGQQFKEFRANLDSLAVSFGSVLLPPVLKIMTALNKFFQVLEKHPLLAKIAGGLVAVAAAAGLVGVAGGGLMKAFETLKGGWIVSALGAIGGALTGLEGGMAVLAGGGIVAGVIALGVAFYELYRHSKLVRDIVADVGKFFVSVWHAAMTAAGAVVKWFVDGPLVWIKQQLQVFSQFWAAHGKEIEQIAKAVWSVIRDYIVTEWKITVDVIKAGLVVLRAVWQVVWFAVRDVVRTVWSVIGQVIHMWIQTILGIIGIGLDLITGKWGKAGHDLETLTGTIFHDVQHIIATIVSGWWHLLWDTGQAMIRGLIGGIESMFGAAIGTVKSLASGVISAAKSVLGIFSPSKVFYDLGANITLGLSSGIVKTIGQATAAARRLAAEVYAAYAKGEITGSEETSLLDRIKVDLARVTNHIHTQIESAKAKLRKDLRDWALTIRAGVVDAIEDATSAGAVKGAIGKLLTIVKDAFNAGDIGYGKATRLTDLLERDNERLQGLAARRAAILKTIAAAEKYAATTTSNIESWAGLSNLSAVTGSATSSTPLTGTGTSTGTLPGQTMTPGTTASTPSLSGQSMLAGLQQNLATIRAFASAIHRLSKLGLNRDLLNQIIQMGPQQGLQVAQALLDGPLSVIKSMNATESAINKAATGLGQTAADAMYDSGKNAGKGFLSGLESQAKQLEKLMDKIAKSMVAAIERALGIRHGGGGVNPGGPIHRAGYNAVRGIMAGAMDATPGSFAGGGGFAGASGGGGSQIGPIHITVQGYIGNKDELAQQLYRLLQQETLRHDRRNAGNGLALSQGRFG